MLANIRIVLVNPSHPGNIGATARAMKTMGLNNLCLVQPKTFPHEQATAMSAGADDLLQSAQVHEDIIAAVKGCHLILGTSTRERGIALPPLDAREGGRKIVEEVAKGDVAILFGREYAGLYNEEIQLCHYHVQIPAAAEYNSLNLAAAVQVISYEIRMAWLATTTAIKSAGPSCPALAGVDEMELLYRHLEEVLLQVKFISHEHPNRIMPRLRRLFNRARVDKVEMSILRGMLAEIERSVRDE